MYLTEVRQHLSRLSFKWLDFATYFTSRPRSPLASGMVSLHTQGLCWYFSSFIVLLILCTIVMAPLKFLISTGTPQKLQNVAWQCSIRKPDYLPLTSGSSPVFHIMKHDCSLKHCSARRAPNWGIYGSGDGYWERWMRLAALFVCNNWNLQVHTTVNVTKCIYLLSAF